MVAENVAERNRTFQMAAVLLTAADIAAAVGLGSSGFLIGFMSAVSGAAFLLFAVFAYTNACGQYAIARGYSEAVGALSTLLAIGAGILLISSFGSALIGSVVGLHLLPVASGLIGILPVRLLPDRRP